MRQAINAVTLPVKGGVILYDPEQRGKVHEHVFALSYWRARNVLSAPLGGRGAAWRIDDDHVDWVLRFYRRGGLPGRFLLDQYLFTGLERTRPWREWRLLARMHELGLPVPRPVAARVLRSGLGYRGAIITETLPGESFTRLLLEDAMTVNAWRNVGTCIRRFHDAGIWHADLNAHNILIDQADGPEPSIYLIDFDRSRMRPQDVAWRRGNLSRLQRSLAKVAPRPDQLERVRAGWPHLEAGYRQD